LQLWLELEFEDVVMEVEQNGHGVAFGRAVPGGARVMSYGDLEVRDARGRLLQAEMVRGDENLFSIVVADADAVYPVLVDPLSFSPDWIAEGDQLLAAFGVSVASAGDVNGDGYSDVIVGAWQYSNGQNYEGRALVYYGSSTGLSTSPNWTMESNQAGAMFGSSVAGAGDVNGDGYSDVIVGAYLFNDGVNDDGRAFVYHGSSSGLNTFPSWIVTSNQGGSWFGYSVAGAGDLNGDGYSDVIVGASHHDSGQNDEGGAFVYHGSSSGLNNYPSWIRHSNQTGALFGESVAGAGDVNGDGYSDVIVGAPEYGSGQGRAFVYYGSSSGLNSFPSWTAESDQIAAHFGSSVAGAGDVNGDGYSDVIVGADDYNSVYTDEGGAFVYYGSSSGPSVSPDWTALGNQSNAYFGESVAGAGDVNGDGYSDVIIGAWSYKIGFDDVGRAFVYYGSTGGLSDSPSWTDQGDADNAGFGHSVASAGDVNGDGYSDVIVGAPGYAPGRAYVYHGSATDLGDTAAWTAEINQDNAYFGFSVATAGDVNGDGYSDAIIGAPYYDNGQDEEGRAYVYHGSPTGLDATPAWIDESDQSSAYLGFSVGGAGDVNGDGYSDVIVGASHYDSGHDDEGRAYVYHGGPSGLSVSPDWTAESNQDYAWFGRSVATAGDVDGDGYSDVIVGSPWYNNGQTHEGRAYVYHGAPTGLNTSYDWIAESNQSFAEFGRSVAPAGDVNGDGYSDVMIGAHRYSNGQTNEGRAYVYHGSSSGLGVGSDWTGESNQADAYFGFSVATAGDVNGDGYSDVIVGAYGYDNAQTDQGRAYVYHGSSTGLAAAWTAEYDQAEASFGYSVATAGDVNGDGYSDVIIGAYLFDYPTDSEGRAFVYHGSSSGLSTAPDWTADGSQDSAYFGYSVATAGDVNGDGYSDVIIGASQYDNEHYNEGRAFVYYGNDGDGLHMLPRQWRADLITPVVPALKTYSQSQAGMGLLARTFFGRGDLRVQFEIKDLGTPFDGTGLSTTSWRDPGTTGTNVNATIGGLSNETMYKWRARIQYHLSSGVPQMYSRWYYQPYNGGLGEADFQVRGVDLPPDAPELSIVRLNPSTCRLSWYSVPGATSYRLYRGTAGFFLPISPWHTVSAPGTYYDFSIGVGNPATNYFFLCRTLGNGGESEDSNRVGEFDYDAAGVSFNRPNSRFRDDDRRRR
jgi:hypothetical protein